MTPYFVVLLPILIIMTMHFAACDSAFPRLGLTSSVRPSGA